MQHPSAVLLAFGSNLDSIIIIIDCEMLVMSVRSPMRCCIVTRVACDKEVLVFAGLDMVGIAWPCEIMVQWCRFVAKN